MPEWEVVFKRGKKQWTGGITGPQQTIEDVRAHVAATAPECEVLEAKRTDLLPDFRNFTISESEATEDTTYADDLPPAKESAQ